MLGHIGIQMAIVFGWLPGGKFSDGALVAIDKAKTRIFRDDWLDVLNVDEVRKSVYAICEVKRSI